MRLFVAIDLPDDIRQSVADICRGLPGVRWLPPEQLHLTLRFIGDADDAVNAAIRKGLATIASLPFPLALNGAGCFPSPRRPRVLWVGLNGGEPLMQLQQKVETVVVMAAGLPAEERPFSPHITLARLKGTPHHLLAPYEEEHRWFAATPFPVAEFHLYSSTLTPSGALHRREGTYQLTSS